MPAARQPGPPADGDPASQPARRPASIQHYESPDDAAEAKTMADQRSADQSTARNRPVPAADGAPPRAAQADRQSTAGVPATPVEPTGRAVTAGPGAPVGAAAATGEPAADRSATTRRLNPVPVVPGRADRPQSFALNRTTSTPPSRAGRAEPLVVDPPPIRTAKPTAEPTVKPTAEPTAEPAVEPTAEPTVQRTAEPTAEPTAQPTAVPGAGLGRAPVFLAVSSFGVLIVALAYAGGRHGDASALVTYWIGQLVVFTPVVARLLYRRSIGAAESFLLVMGLAVNQYLLKWMYSPDQLRFPDELQHWLATTLVMQSGELFSPNLALPVAVHFPGLAEMGAAVAALTGLPVTAAGFLVAGMAHLIFVAALYATVQRASGSPAVAGVTCVVYATAMHYLFFNSMYVYETAALPFLMVAVWATRRWRAVGGWPYAALAVASIAVTTVSHHVTAFVLVATLSLLAAGELATGGKGRRWSALTMPAVALAIVVGWITLVARDVIGYLEAPIDQVVRTVAVLMSGDSTGAAISVAVSPWQLAIQGSGLVALFVLYLAVGRDLLRRRLLDAWRWSILVGAAVFFAGNAVRFLGQDGPEVAGRLSTFTYVPMSILAAVALVEATRIIPRRNAAGQLWRGAPPVAGPPATGRRLVQRVVAGSSVLTLLMIGARVGGWPPTWSMLPGPYLVSGFERSVDAYGVAAADWQRRTLGPGNRVGGDATSVFLSATYGRQDPVRQVGELYFADEWRLTDDDLVSSLALGYLVVDRRLATQRPASGAYFELDPQSGQHRARLTAGQLAKFDGLTDVDRLYDNGIIRVYRLGES